MGMRESLEKSPESKIIIEFAHRQGTDHGLAVKKKLTCISVQSFSSGQQNCICKLIINLFTLKKY